MANKHVLNLSQDQQRAMLRFQSFIDSDDKVFILSGYAGTGKTTIVREMIDSLKKRDVPTHLLASTGRASKILCNATGQSTSTVHGLIYTFVDFNKKLKDMVTEDDKPIMDDNGQLLLQFELNRAKDASRHYYFIDEASMVSDMRDPNESQAHFGSGQLLKDLLAYDASGKYIFIGDSCQLPPVGQSFSPALSKEYFILAYGVSVVETTMTEIMRQQKGNDIIVAAQGLRKLYQNPQTWKWAKSPLKGFNNVHLVASQADLVDMYIDRIKKHGYNHSTMIVRSNSACEKLTRIMRPSLGLTSQRLQKGDLLLVTQNNLISGLMNGDLVEVKDIGTSHIRAGLTFVRVTVEELYTKRSFSQLLIEEIVYGRGTNLTQMQQKELFIDFYIRMKNSNIEQEDEQFKEEMRKDEYLNALRAVFGLVLTCHKSQGGEWDEVFIDIPRNYPLEQKPYVYQWLYTAITRAKKDIYMVDDFYMM